MQMSLVHNTWLVIGNELDFVLKNSGWDPNNIHKSKPMDRLNLFNTFTRQSIFCRFKLDAMITGKVSYLPKNTYLRWGGKVLRSSFVPPR